MRKQVKTISNEGELNSHVSHGNHIDMESEQALWDLSLILREIAEHDVNSQVEGEGINGNKTKTKIPVQRKV